MSQGTRNTKLQEEMAKYEDSFDKKLDLKFASLSEKLPSKADFNELKDLFNGLNEKILYQDRKIASLEKDNTDFEERILSLEERVSVLEQTNIMLYDKNAVLSSSIDYLKSQSDSHEQYSRRSCLRINGIKQAENESSSDCVDKVIDVCKDLNLDVKKEDIDRAHRVGRDRKTMIVKFYSFGKRTSVYKERKKAKNDVKIHLDLTKPRLNLLDKAKELITDDSCVDFVFADINCNVVARLKINKYKFFNLEDFKDKILNRE